MTVRELIEMLQEADPNAEVVATDLYDTEQTFKITSMVHGPDMVNLTNEDLD